MAEVSVQHLVIYRGRLREENFLRRERQQQQNHLEQYNLSRSVNQATAHAAGTLHDLNLPIKQTSLFYFLFYTDVQCLPRLPVQIILLLQDLHILHPLCVDITDLPMLQDN